MNKTENKEYIHLSNAPYQPISVSHYCKSLHHYTITFPPLPQPTHPTKKKKPSKKTKKQQQKKNQNNKNPKVIAIHLLCPPFASLQRQKISNQKHLIYSVVWKQNTR